MERTLTIEDMIKQGATWADITARVKELQREEAERKAAAEAEAEREKLKKIRIKTARKRFIAAFADWMVAVGALPEQEREEFCAELSKDLTAEMLFFTPLMMR